MKAIKALPYVLVISLLYLLAGILWISFSDHIVASLASTEEQLHLLASIKTWLGVALTLLFIILVIIRKPRDVKFSHAAPHESTAAAQDATELALEESRRRLHTLMNNLPGMAFRCRIDPKWPMEFVSEGARKLTGYEAKQLLENNGFSYGDIILPDDREPVWKDVQHAVDNGEPYEMEYRIRTADGNVKHVWERGHGVLGERGSVEAVEGLIVDVTDRWKAEEELRRSERKLRNIFESNIYGAMFWNLQGEILDSNDAFLEMTGYSREDLLSGRLRWDKLTPEEWKWKDDIALEEISNRRYISPYEKEYIRKDGSRIPVILAAAILEEDSETGIAVVLDNSEIKRAEKTIQQNEERLRLSTEVAGVAIWEYDVLNNRMSRSDNHDGLYGLEQQEECVIETFLNATHPEDRDESMRVIKATLEPGGPDRYHFDFRVIWPDDSVHWLTVIGEAAQRDTTGYATLVRGCLMEVTERKEAEESLRQSESSLRQAQKIASLGNWELEIATGKITWSEEIYRMFGMKPRESGLTLDLYRRFVHPEDRIIIDNFYDTLATRKRGTFEYRLVRPTGAILWVSGQGKVTLDENGNPVKMFGVMQDVTMAKQLELELKEAHDAMEQRVEERTAELLVRKNEAEELNRAMINLLEDLKQTNSGLKAAEKELRRSNKELESFSYSVSHDLRAPLRHIDGFVQLLLTREKGRLDSTSAKYLQTIAQSSYRMGMLIDDLLAFSRTGRTEMHFQPLDSKKIVQEAIDELSPVTAGRQIVWEIGDLPRVKADRGLLLLVWLNLIDNAVKYTGQREEARIDIGVTEKWINDEGGEHVFFIRDNGVGFDPQYAHKLFGVFQRLHRRDEFEGTGIGLATVRRIIQRHGGRVWAEGEINQGATFYFSLKQLKEKNDEHS